jgi:hypothetical protein
LAISLPPMPLWPSTCWCKNYPRSRPWRPIRLWDVEAPTVSRQSAHRWR